MSDRQKPPPPPELPVTLTAGVPAWDFVRRNRHVTVPLALPALFAGAGFTAAAFPRGRGYLVTACAVAAACMYLAAPHKWDRAREQWYARLSVIMAGGWLCVTAWTGITRWTLIALAAGVLAWGIPWFLHKRPREQKAAKGAIAQWNVWWQHHALSWGLPGSAVIDVTLKGPVVTLRIQLWAGRQHARQVTDAAHLIESALRGFAGPGMVRVAGDHHNASQALVHLKRANPLAGTIRWDASLVPLSVTESAAIGLGEEGAWIRVCLAANWFLIGRSRSGKSNELSLFLAAITGCDDALVWLIDRKGGRAARPWMPAVDWCATTIEEARLMLDTAVAEIRARGTYADDGTEQLRPTTEVPAIFLVVDEAAQVTGLASGDARCAADLASVASMGMGLAVYVIASTQYGALDASVRTEETRSNLPNRICFAVTSQAHGAFALSDYQNLDASRLEKQGSFYYQLGPKADSAPARAPEMTHDLVRSIAARNGAMPRRPLVLYASDHQAVYDARWSRLPAAFRDGAPQYAAWLDAGHSPEEAPVIPAPHGDDMAERLARVDADTAETPDIHMADLPRIPSDAEIRGEVSRRKARFARALMAAPADGISPARLQQATGLGRTWIHQQLSSLTDAGAVIKVASSGNSSAYLAAPGEDVWQAMEAIRAGHGRLLEAARSA
jgi:hypothetical protein